MSAKRVCVCFLLSVCDVVLVTVRDCSGFFTCSFVFHILRRLHVYVRDSFSAKASHRVYVILRKIIFDEILATAAAPDGETISCSRLQGEKGYIFLKTLL